MESLVDGAARQQVRDAHAIITAAYRVHDRAAYLKTVADGTDAKHRAHFMNQTTWGF